MSGEKWQVNENRAEKCTSKIENKNKQQQSRRQIDGSKSSCLPFIFS